MNDLGLLIGILGVIIALILGAAQVWSSYNALKSTKISNENHKLKDDIKYLKEDGEKQQEKILRYANQILFLRFIEESLYAELEGNSTEYKAKHIKTLIRSDVAMELGIKFNKDIDSEIKQDLNRGEKIEAISIKPFKK